MLIWDYIRDFLVQYIFGGLSSDGTSYLTGLGGFGYDDGGNIVFDYYYTGGVAIKSDFVDGSDLSPLYFSIGDWLSTTTTIIIMCLIVVLFAMLVRWVFKTVVSAFLLR